MQDLIILGAGGLGREVAALVESINMHSAQWTLLGFLDSHPGVRGETALGYPVMGPFEHANKYKDAFFVVAFGDALVRRRVVESVDWPGMNWATLVSPDVFLHRTNRVGKGTIITKNSEPTTEGRIGCHVFLNVHCVVGHDVHIGDFTIVSPNVTINGGARIGKACTIGANAFVRDVHVGDNTYIGACSCVVKDIPGDCVVAGVPAQIIREGRPAHSTTKSERKNAE